MEKYMMIIIIMAFIILGILLFLVGKYCRKKPLKIGLLSIIGIISLYCIALSIDINRTNLLRKPIFARENGTMGSIVRYNGLGYKIDIEKEGNRIIQTKMTMSGNVIAAAITSTEGHK